MKYRFVITIFLFNDDIEWVMNDWLLDVEFLTMDLDNGFSQPNETLETFFKNCIHKSTFSEYMLMAMAVLLKPKFEFKPYPFFHIEFEMFCNTCNNVYSIVKGQNI